MAGTTSFNDIKRQFKENKKLRLITAIVIGLIVGILGYILYKQFIYAPKNLKANEGYYKGLNLAAKDSVDAAIQELEPFAKKNDGFQGGEVAKYTLARQYMAKGDFKKALGLLEDVSLDGTYVPSLVLGLQGDCNSEMGKYKEAMNLYIDAAEADENDWTTPTYLFKAGQVAEEIKDFEKAKELYERINKDYYQFGSQKSIDKFIARVSNK
jgi:predicted negative regulator of RcsB-dependent stress response